MHVLIYNGEHSKTLTLLRTFLLSMIHYKIIFLIGCIKNKNVVKSIPIRQTQVSPYPVSFFLVHIYYISVIVVE